MKKLLFLCIVCLCATTHTNAQMRDTTVNMDMHKVDFNYISKKQKNTAWILLAGELGIAAIGGIVQLAADNHRAGDFNLNFTGAGIAVIGGIVSLSSIPFFISSSKNKRKAIL